MTRRKSLNLIMASLPLDSVHVFQWRACFRQVVLFTTELQTDKKFVGKIEQKLNNQHRLSIKLGKTPVPIPQTLPDTDTNPLAKLKNETPKTIIRKGADILINAFKTVVQFILKLPGNFVFYATHPKELHEGWINLRDAAKAEAHHYWVGTKLLWADIQTARKLLGKTLDGNSLTRRERKQLLRTVSDLFRLIPFSMFVIIPFMEFALPFALRLFPNMLPSTYQDSLKAEENMKRELKSRIAMAHFFQE